MPNKMSVEYIVSKKMYILYQGRKLMVGGRETTRDNTIEMTIDQISTLFNFVSLQESRNR